MMSRICKGAANGLQRNRILNLKLHFTRCNSISKENDEHCSQAFKYFYKGEKKPYFNMYMFKNPDDVSSLDAFQKDMYVFGPRHAKPAQRPFSWF